MHPADYVRNKIKEQKVAEIIGLIHKFRNKMIKLKTSETAEVFNFANLFLISVTGQLRHLGPNQDLHDDRLLAIWAELGYYGIERDDLPNELEE